VGGDPNVLVDPARSVITVHVHEVVVLDDRTTFFEDVTSALRGGVLGQASAFFNTSPAAVTSSASLARGRLKMSS